MAICLRSVSNKLILFNQFTSPGKVLSQRNIKISSKSLFLIEFLSKRSVATCPSINIVNHDHFLGNVGNVNLNGRKETTNSTKNVHKLYLLNSNTNESYKIKNQRKRRDVVHLSCISGKLSRTFPSGIHTSPLLSDFEKQMILLAESKNIASGASPLTEPSKNDLGKPSEEQLKRVYDVLADTLPKLFIQPLSYDIYHHDIVFENNIRGTRTVGLYNYVKQVAILRTIGHLKFAFVKFDILKITLHPEDSTVKVRWRIRGVSGLKAFVSFWRFKIWELKEAIQKEEEAWYDGFSVFHVGGDGLVYKHVADKMQPDNDEAPVKPKVDTLGAKLALMLGLSSRDLADFSLFLSNHKIAMEDKSCCLSELMFPLDKIE